MKNVLPVQIGQVVISTFADTDRQLRKLSCLINIMNYSNFWDNVLKQEEWNDELKRWENTHPEYQPFKEDSDSQRQQND